MDIELDDDERVELREEDKTRQLVVPVRGPTIDDLGSSGETALSALPAPDVAPFGRNPDASRAAPRAAPPAPREPIPEPPREAPKAAMTRPADAETEPSPKNPPERLPPLPASAGAAPIPEVSSPTIVVKEIVHVPTQRRMQREATVVVKRAVRKTRRSPVLVALIAAVVILASAIAFVGIRRVRESAAREERIEQRIEEIRRAQSAP